MNGANLVHLEGRVHGDNWTRWTPGKRGQVRFWLAVDRAEAAGGFDLFLCVLELFSVEDMRTYEREVRPERAVTFNATAYTDRRDPDGQNVFFVGSEVSFDGGAAMAHVRTGRKANRLSGKLAAAGERADDVPLLAGLGSAP